MMYRVLWIDDNPPKGFVGDALDADIQIMHFRSNQKGFAYLEQHLADFDAVLLDAISFEREDQVAGTEHERALGKALQKLAELSHRKYFPSFILTGQEKLVSDSSFGESYENYYQKGGDDEDRLFNDIKKAVDELPETKLRHRYAPAFAACSKQLLGENAGSLLIKVLQGLEKPSTDHDDDSLFNTLRKLVEAFLYAAHRQQLLPDQCLKGSEVNLTAAYYFFASASGQPMNPPHGGDSVKLRQATLPKILTESLRTLIELTSNGSHYQQNALITQGQRQEAKIQLQTLRETVRTPYLLAALTYQLLDLLVWLKEVVDKPALLQAYRGAWDTIATSTNSYTSGTVTGISPLNGSGEFTAVPSGEKALIHQSAMQAQSLQIGDEVEAVLKPSDRPGRYQQVVQSLRKTVRPAGA